MFHQRSDTLGFRVGELIPFEHLKAEGVRQKSRVRLLRKHIYRIARRKPGVFTTEKRIAHPASRQNLKKELARVVRPVTASRSC